MTKIFDGRVRRSSRVYRRRARLLFNERKFLVQILHLSSSEVKKQFKYKVPLIIWVGEPIKGHGNQSEDSKE